MLRSVRRAPSALRAAGRRRALSSATPSAAPASLFERIKDAWLGPNKEGNTYRRTLESTPVGVRGAQFRRSAEQMIADVPPIVVSGTVAVCRGGEGVDAALGHPVEYIQLNVTRAGEPETCKYCGLRYVAAPAH